ncbi:DUF899 family protein [Homoserinimonas sp. OAct 916]|uniref:DUF899 family protein n=1 Tax=Homoserinimonas sp. OAct 916 TaxID=2211450 RepID=UPI000DBE8378|nr:DUF899 family protein [Homoserinimonas sp. OAct 916]
MNQAREATPALPPVVSAAAWQRSRDELMVLEKAATRSLDALAARRRRLPMARFSDYTFTTATGTTTLRALFGDNRQLAVYQFMDVGADGFCPGCTHFTRNVTDLATLAEAGLSWATVSEMPIGQIERLMEREGWTLPFVSSRGTTFYRDCGGDGGFMLSVFLRDGDDIYRTYSTVSRGVDRLLFVNNMLDLAPYGRQEDWEDSPAGWPQQPTYG